MSAEKVAHTPGPWTMRSGSIWGTSKDPDGEYICEPWGRTHAETEANGRLIAAAPDLLALAKRYASDCSECGGTGSVQVCCGSPDQSGSDDDVCCGVPDTEPCDACADIRAVIEKAEGGA